MCTRPTPSCDSISASARAFVVAIFTCLHALAFLCVALASAPLRRIWPSVRQRRPTSLAHVDVQVHLGDAACIAELEKIVWRTLARAERTWRPLALPVDRVVVGAGFPAAGRADIYDDFLAIVDDGQIHEAEPQHRRRIVISLGVRDGARDLDAWEIAGALAAQIQALVDERYGKHTCLAAQVPDQRPATVATTRLTRPPVVSEQRGSVLAEPIAGNGHDLAVISNGSAQSASDEDVPCLGDVLATIQEGQPLIAAGPSSNGTTHT
jgi:hypothetical protein